MIITRKFHLYIVIAATLVASVVYVVSGAVYARADDFKIAIDDKSSLVALTMAREQYNATRSDGSDGPFDTDADYFEFRTRSMLTNLAQQLGIDLPKIDANIAELQAKRAEIVAKTK